jgi:hypothetical protein
MGNKMDSNMENPAEIKMEKSMKNPAQNKIEKSMENPAESKMEKSMEIPAKNKMEKTMGTTVEKTMENTMDQQAVATLAAPLTDDGWEDAAVEANERVIKGTLLKFADGRWTKGKEGTPVEDGTRLVAVSTAAGWVKWKDSKPAEYRMRPPGHRLPDREELGELDEAAWEAGPDGKARDPWQSTRFVYLVDLMTAEAFTFSTSGFGGRAAVSDLADQIQRMRFARPGAVPVVELRAAPMLTKFGRKSKPWFKVVGWRSGGSDEGNGAPLPPSSGQPPELEHSSTAGETAQVLDDDIPF